MKADDSAPSAESFLRLFGIEKVRLITSAVPPGAEKRGYHRYPDETQNPGNQGADHGRSVWTSAVLFSVIKPALPVDALELYLPRKLFLKSEKLPDLMFSLISVTSLFRKIQIMFGCEHRAEHLPCLEQVPKVGPRIVLAGMTAAALLDRLV